MAVSVVLLKANLKPPIIKVGFFIINKKMNKIILAGIIVISVGLVVYGFVAKEQPQLKGATSGLYSTLAVATTTAVGPQQVKTIFSSSQCVSRVVGTAGQAVMLTFGDPVNGDVSSTTLTSMVGHWQGASTTVAYDAEIYGCGRWSAFGVLASTTITTAEMR